MIDPFPAGIVARLAEHFNLYTYSDLDQLKPIADKVRGWPLAAVQDFRAPSWTRFLR